MEFSIAVGGGGVFSMYLYFCGFCILLTHMQSLYVDPTSLGCFGDQMARKYM